MIAKNRMRGLAYASCNCREENIDEVNNCDNYLEQLINEHFDNLSLNKTAKEMFEEIGYERDDDVQGDYIRYEKYFPETSVTFEICFDLTNKECGLEASSCEGLTISFDAKEHKAIHQQMEELGWLDE